MTDERKTVLTDDMVRRAERAFERSYSKNVYYDGLENEFVALRCALRAALRGVVIDYRCGVMGCSINRKHKVDDHFPNGSAQTG